MNISTFQNIGRREYQEDTMYISNDNKLFVVCDGVGGSAKGSLASKAVSDYIQNYYELHKFLDNNLIENMITEAEEHLCEIAKTDPAIEGLSTTLALLYIAKDKILTAHIGDSRIYHLNIKGDYIWFTKDHSLVQELFDSGVLTSEEQMSNHPLRNRITKAISGFANKNDNPTFPAIDELQNTGKGDILLLCTDGVIEHLTNHELVMLLSNSNFKEGVDSLNKRCLLESKDNNTCIAIQL